MIKILNGENSSFFELDEILNFKFISDHNRGKPFSPWARVCGLIERMKYDVRYLIIRLIQ